MILRAEIIKVHHGNQVNRGSDNVLAKLEGGDEESGGGVAVRVVWVSPKLKS